jgi:LmbE family N-acetylglucosaminyl deacetylase
MKPGPKSPPKPLLAFGAHPDDIEFGAGGIVAREAAAGRPVHFVVCSRGEAGTHGTPAVRTAEARKAARLLGATVEFVRLDGDARLELRATHAKRLAAIVRRVRPGLVLAPSPERNQHPDHWRLAILVRDALRLARYGGLKPLRKTPAHAVGQLFFYALSPSAEPAGQPVLTDISAPGLLQRWTQAMEAHASQMKTRNYVELQLARARVHGLNAGLAYAQPLWLGDPAVVDDLSTLARGARRF